MDEAKLIKNLIQIRNLISGEIASLYITMPRPQREHTLLDGARRKIDKAIELLKKREES